MLGMASKASSDVPPVIEWRQGDATSMPLPDGAFDVVLCQQGLQFFPDQPAALSEMHRVLTPNGRLALSVCDPSSTTRATICWPMPWSST
jgi:ubiquinone/menaquinone biosynthesis C-methylase UbiE